MGEEKSIITHRIADVIEKQRVKLKEASDALRGKGNNRIAKKIEDASFEISGIYHELDKIVRQ